MRSHDLLSPAHCLLRILSTQLKSVRSSAFISRGRGGNIVLKRRAHFINHRAIASTNIQTPKTFDQLAIFTKDEDIKASFVRLKGSDDKIGNTENLSRILQNIDRESEVVLQLASPEGGIPIVQITKKAELRKRLLEKQRAQKAVLRARKETKPKQIEVNWAISEHDLDLKLKQLQGFIDDGKSVQVLLASKKRQRRATMDEGEAVLQKLRKFVGNIEAREATAMTGEVLKQAILTIKKKSA